MNLDSSLAGKNDLRCDTMRPHFHSRWCANGACSLIGIWDSAGCTVFSTDEWETPGVLTALRKLKYFQNLKTRPLGTPNGCPT